MWIWKIVQCFKSALVSDLEDRNPQWYWNLVMCDNMQAALNWKKSLKISYSSFVLVHPRSNVKTVLEYVSASFLFNFFSGHCWRNFKRNLNTYYLGFPPLICWILHTRFIYVMFSSVCIVYICWWQQNPLYATVVTKQLTELTNYVWSQSLWSYSLWTCFTNPHFKCDFIVVVLHLMYHLFSHR